MGGMDAGEILSAEDLEAFLQDTCRRAGFAAHAADSIAQTVVAAEQAGQRRLGLGLVPQMIEHARCGRVNPIAEPDLTQTDAAVLAVDAGGGFSCPAIAMATDRLATLTREHGLACLVLHRSYPVGSLLRLHRDLSETGLTLLARVDGLVPRAGVSGAVYLEVAPVSFGLPGGPWPEPAWPRDLHGAVHFEGPVGPALSHTHRFVAVRSEHWPGDAAMAAPAEESAIAVPASLLETIINA